MKKISILWLNSKRKDILIWDNNNQDILTNSFGDYSWDSLNTRTSINIAPIYIFKALIIFLNNLTNTKYCSNGIINKNKYSFFNKKVISFLKRINYSLSSILSIATVLYYRPKLIISNTDNSVYFEYLDSIINKHIPVITIQNGNRWHSSLFQDKNGFNHFYNPPGFHSCFAALSEIDIKMYKDSGWKCYEYHNVGSINANYSFEINKIEKKYDICVIANSINNRKSEIKLAELLINFQKRKNFKICIALKLSPSQKGYKYHYKEIFKLYGKSVDIIPKKKKNLTIIFSSEVVLGTFSTALREVFSLGKKIYPINFDYKEINSYTNCLDLNLCPSQPIFNYELEKLLNLKNDTYKEKYKREIKYIGSFPQDVNPSKRLLNLIDEKIKR